ncbi:hypothetical protein [Granulosicoccus antarcticus]|uniref:Secreted protein n=1 Tax=Granulosicoccus antarcticus IMCC3135 TaxID=1192854 RepID=A0A2Z2P8B6_9GAMM|nr:hypothetical protein [Granulosicoccus antarcticus]ASJ76094.1 hypothetical protein IMCC3135_30225 [Granulosicoccus antarcticus IMCC3135]
MACSLAQLVIITPLLVAGPCAWASDIVGQAINYSDPFELNPAELDPIRFTRSKIERGGDGSSNVESDVYQGRDNHIAARQTEFSFKLKPKLPDFSRKGAYGLDLFTEPRLDVHSRLMGPARIGEVIPELNDGFAYSAGLRIEHEDKDINGTAYVSSSLLGLSYGRLGRLWYGGIDVNLEQFTDDATGVEQPDVLSLDFTTGRRLGFTGLSTNSPLWLVSVQGNLDLLDEPRGDEVGAKVDWYLNPSLFWQQPGFTFSAQMQLPVEFETLDDDGEPDYRLRAVFEKQFK